MQHETLQKVKEMQERTGHVLVVVDIESIAKLDLLADKVADPTSGIDSPLTAHAVYVRGVPVYPITLSHLQYIDEAGEFFPEDGMETIVALWVATLKYIPADYYEKNEARRSLKRWWKHSRWTENDVQAVMELRYKRLMDNQGGEEGDGTGALIGLLVREYGSSAEYWMNTAPIELVDTMIADWQRRQNAQAAAYAKGAKGKATPPAPTPKYEAVKRFRQEAERIEASWLNAA